MNMTSLEHSSIPGEAVQSFYDHFFNERMLQYRVEGNLRIQRAIERIIPLVSQSSQVLEIGCGIGIVADAIAKKASGGRIVAIDISKQNIWYARRTVRDVRISFYRIDILQQFSELRALIQNPIDLFVLVDVIEHVPSQDRASLFERMGEVAAQDARVVLTYPSPQYQGYLRKEEPGGLQIIDNTIELPELIREAGGGGFTLRHFSLEDVWMKNQYVHCVFQKDDALRNCSEAESERRTVSQRLTSAFVHRVTKHAVVRYRRWKYIDRIFGNKQS
jgi:trans-aconitate 2-methyltransferase